MIRKIFLFLCFFLSLRGASFAAQILVENVFSDISSSYEYRDELQALYDRGMIIPDVSGKFNPDTFLNRDEFVGIAMEVICERCIAPHTEYQYVEKYFNTQVYFDIDNDNRYFYCVAEADERNSVRGYGLGESCQNGSNKIGERPFCPLNRINLEEAIAVLLRNSGIFTIGDNAEVVENIRAGNISGLLGGDVSPINSDGSPYTFYGYLEKALSYSITEYDVSGVEKNFQLLELDDSGNINPKQEITKEQFLRMSYIALKSNNCTEIEDNGLALRMNIFEKVCTQDDLNCALSNLEDPENTYDFDSEVEGICELGIEDSTGYIWRYQNLTNGKQEISYGPYIDNHILSSDGEWRIYLRVVDRCGNTSEIHSTIFVGDDSLGPITDQEIDVDIDVFDDVCTFPGTNCREIQFENEEDDGDDIFDFDGDVSTSCNIGNITYSWEFTNQDSGDTYNYDGEYIDDILLGKEGTWNIVLIATDGCGNTGREQMTYIVGDDNTPILGNLTAIDVDIDVFDDSCNFLDTTCVEIEFENEEDDGDDIFDFSADVDTDFSTEELTYEWTFVHFESGTSSVFTTPYVNDFYFSFSGEWNISLGVTDPDGNTGREQMTYIIADDSTTIVPYSIDVSILANPISGYEDLLVNFEGTVSGGTGPYTYSWDFGDEKNDLGEKTDHIYDSDGTFEIELTVTDVYGAIGTASVVIIVFDADSCDSDSDSDGVNDCEDACPLVPGDTINNGCPILERSCDASCGCTTGYTCSSDDPLTCGSGICEPDFDPKPSCLYNPGEGGIFGSALCTTCPCNTFLDFTANIRRCDLIFPAITSPDGSEIYSRGDTWQIQ